MSDALSPASRAVLRQLVSSRRVDLVPAELVALNLVRADRIKRVDGLVGLIWVPTKAGVLVVARMEDGE